MTTKQNVALGVAALGALAAAVYWLDKRQHYAPTTEPNPLAPATTDQTLLIKAPAGRVWQVLSDIDHWADWQPDIRGPRLNGPLQAGTSFDWRTSGLAIHSTLHTVAPKAALGWSGKAFGAFAVHNWTLRALPGGRTQVRVQESMEGWLVQLLRPFFQTGLSTSIATWLSRLRQAAEQPAPVPQAGS